MENQAIQTVIELAKAKQSSIIKCKDVITACDLNHINTKVMYQTLLRAEYRVPDRKGYYDFTPLIGEVQAEPVPWSIDEVTGRPIMLIGKTFANRAQRAEFNRLYDEWEDSLAERCISEDTEIEALDFDNEPESFDFNAEIGYAMAEAHSSDLYNEDY